MCRTLCILCVACLALTCACGARDKEAAAWQPATQFERRLQEVLDCTIRPQPLGTYGSGAAPEDMIYAMTVGDRERFAAVGRARGYQGEVQVLLSIEGGKGQPLPDDPAVFRTLVIASNETEGYGTKTQEVPAGWPAGKAPPFHLQFWGKRLSELGLDAASAGEGIAAISGATHTSRAAVDAARQAAERIVARVAEARLTRHR